MYMNISQDAAEVLFNYALSHFILDDYDDVSATRGWRFVEAWTRDQADCVVADRDRFERLFGKQAGDGIYVVSLSPEVETTGATRHADAFRIANSWEAFDGMQKSLVDNLAFVVDLLLVDVNFSAAIVRRMEKTHSFSSELPS
jgi:hypothetical protein